ncbi:hypothetical protein ElyMa_006630600, partial [Elysia marginata]
MMTVSGISAALNLPIQSYCPPMQNAYFLSEPLSHVVRGPGVTEGKKSGVTLMWTSTLVPNKQSQFRPNHFVVLKKRQSDTALVDLTNDAVVARNEVDEDDGGSSDHIDDIKSHDDEDGDVAVIDLNRDAVEDAGMDGNVEGGDDGYSNSSNDNGDSHGDDEDDDFAMADLNSDTVTDYGRAVDVLDGYND